MKNVNSLQEEEYYIGIQSPILLRKNVLETSKGAISLLKNYSNLIKIRDDKNNLIIEYKKHTSDINALIAQLKSSLPKIQFEESVKKVDKVLSKSKVQLKNKNKVEKVVKEKTELEILEEQLNSIEEELKSLS